MSKKNILIVSLFTIAVICAGTVTVLNFMNKKPSHTSPDTPTTTKTATDAADLQKEAESVIVSDPKTASDKFQEASDIYKDTGEADKAAENAANAAAADAGIQNSTPPTTPPPDSSAPR